MKRLMQFWIIVFILFIFLAIFTGVKDYINDSILFIILVIFVYKFKKILNLSKLSFILIGLSMMLHNLGVFGFYGKFEWYDILTHIFGLSAVGFSVFFFLKDKFKNKLLLILAALMVSSGIGVIIENIEYGGYLILGEGEGAFLYGEGDFQGEKHAAWIDSMQDLINNWIGALLGIFIAINFKKLLRS
ncbi:hypothetical protein HY498_00605 [Candidatus Woesearchaeota archaeon]|nr:hypothetical protein [Candidatus Woesearchaeota archaeon]